MAAPVAATCTHHTMPAAPPRGFGVSIAAFDAVIDAAGGRESLLDKSTAWVKENIVLPATRDAMVPYISVLRAWSGAQYVDEATAFISHAYAYPFLAVVDAVRAWEAQQPASAFYYFDLFVVNQHGQTMGVRPELLWNEFCGNVARIGRTLVVCMWRSPILPFSRVWCLAEIATALGDDRSGAFTIVMPLEEERAFAASLAGNFDDLVRKSCTIDLAAAKAYHCDQCTVLDAGGRNVCRHVLSEGSDHIEECPNDCAFVRKAIRDGMGFDAANERVAAAVREWMARAGLAALDALPAPERDASDLASGYARLLSDQGRIAEAERRFAQVLEARETHLGKTHPRTLSAQYDYAYHLAYLSRLAAAEALLRSALADQRALLGEEHIDVIKSAFALARCLFDQRQYKEADALFTLVVRVRRASLGRDHAETLEALKHHGVLLEKWGRLADAGECLREALEGQRRANGEFHPQTLSTMHKYATLLMSEGKVAEAAPLFHAAHAGRRRVLGDAHPHTLWSVAKVANLRRLEGRYAEAEALCREAYDGFRRAFGDAHPAATDALSRWDAARALLVGASSNGTRERHDGAADAGIAASHGSLEPVPGASVVSARSAE